jgi:phage tail tape-measure protein
MTTEELYKLKDEMHQKIDAAFESLEKEIPREKGASADLTDIAKDAWELWKEGIGEIASAAGTAYAEYVDQ